MSAFADVLDAIVAGLQSAPAIAGGRIRTNPEVPLPAEHASDVVVWLDDVQGEQIVIGDSPLLWQARYMLQARARGATAFADADALIAEVYARIEDTAAPAGVEGWFITPALSPRYGFADTEAVTISLGLDVRLRTLAGTLTTGT